MLVSGPARARLPGDDFPRKAWRSIFDESGAENALRDLLIKWCLAGPKPLVLLVDEIDSLVGDTSLSVLRQLRSGYEQRSDGFPASIILCGVRDVSMRGASPSRTAAEGFHLKQRDGAGAAKVDGTPLSAFRLRQRHHVVRFGRSWGEVGAVH